MNIYKTATSDSLSEQDLERVEKLDVDYIVYNYIDGGYDGTGIAVWKKGNKYGYVYLGHFSCNGPFEDLNSILYTFAEIEMLSNSNKYEWHYSKPVMDKIKEIEGN